MKRFSNWQKTALLFLLIFITVFLVLSAAALLKNRSDRDFSITLDRFQSDFAREEKPNQLYEDQILKTNQFIAFGAYTPLGPGIYRAVFDIQSADNQAAVIDFQIASDKGKSLIFHQSLTVNTFPTQQSIRFKLLETKEVEPRMLFVSGNPSLTLEKATLTRIKGIYPWKSVLFKALFAAFFSTLLLLTVLSSCKHSPKWKVYLTLFFFLAGFFLILRNAWVSEDAFITLRHVENFIDGHGPVFNLNERVEGYTHPLWFAVISAFRGLGMSPKGSVMLPGLFFSFLALYILFFKIDYKNGSNSQTFLNPAAVVLVGTSAYIDFGTSGLETSLSYFLLVLYAKFLAESRWKSHPFWMGLIVTLLVLTRPDYGVFLIFLILYYCVELFRKEIAFKHIASFMALPFVILGLHELFRLGYYAALMPNPFYSKSGAAAHFQQGIKYLVDFGQGSLIYGIILIVTLAILLNFNRKDIKNRLLVLFSGILHGFFVIRGGGDFMHGRFLLPAVLLFTAAAVGAFDRFFEKKVHQNLAYLTACTVLFAFSLSIVPVQKKGQFYNHGISNERYAYYGKQIIPIKYLFEDTVIFIWKTIGVNFKDLSMKARLRPRLAYLNVGFTGFYSGKNIYLIDRLGLTDPVVSRISLDKRGRPGHEKSAPFGYLVLRKLTFGETPYPLWNETAVTPYGILWDLSPKTLDKLGFVLDERFKTKIDKEVLSFLSQLDEAGLPSQADFLYFLKQFWYPFADEECRLLFDEKYRAGIIHENSPSWIWIERNKDKVETIFSRLEGPIDLKAFLQNIKFALTQGRRLKFSSE